MGQEETWAALWTARDLVLSAAQREDGRADALEADGHTATAAHARQVAGVLRTEAARFGQRMEAIERARMEEAERPAE